MAASDNPFRRISPRDPETRLVHVIVDTPRGSAIKYKYDEKLELYKVARILPLGMYFHYDFGSIPGTRAQDGGFRVERSTSQGDSRCPPPRA